MRTTHKPLKRWSWSAKEGGLCPSAVLVLVCLGRRALPLSLCWSWSAWEGGLCPSVCAGPGVSADKKEMLRDKDAEARRMARASGPGSSTTSTTFYIWTTEAGHSPVPTDPMGSGKGKKKSSEARESKNGNSGVQ